MISLFSTSSSSCPFVRVRRRGLHVRNIATSSFHFYSVGRIKIGYLIIPSQLLLQLLRLDCLSKTRRDLAIPSDDEFREVPFDIAGEGGLEEAVGGLRVGAVHVAPLHQGGRRKAMLGDIKIGDFSR